VNRRNHIALVVWALGLAACVWIIARTPFTTDMSAFLPTAPEPAQQVLVQQLRDGVASRLILIGLDGATPEAQAGVSRKMAQSLREFDGFVLVENGDGTIGKDDKDYVWRNRYLLNSDVTATRFSAEGLRQALRQDLQMLSSGMEPMLKDSLPHDPTGEAIGLLRTLAGGAQHRVRDGVWVSPDDRQTLILAQTLAPGFDLDAQERGLNAIRQSFATTQKSVEGADGMRMVASGPGIFGVNTRAQMKHDVTIYSAIASAGIVGLLLAAYRSLLVLGLTLVPVVSGALAGLAAVSLWYGFVHGITIGFGVTLIGEAVDYAIYLFAQTKRQGGAQTTLGRIWPTLRLGVLVSICGFAAMLFSSFIGFVQLGIFTIAGLAVAVSVTRFVLPSLLTARFSGTRRIGFSPSLLALVLRARQLRIPLFVVLAVAVAIIAAHTSTFWQDDLSSMSPIPAADQQIDRQLRQATGAPDVRYIAVATAQDMETLLQAAERTSATLDQLVSSHALSGYDSPDRYLPSLLTQTARRAALPDPQTLAGNLKQAADGLPFRPEAFAPFLGDVEAARQAPPLTRASLTGAALSLKLDSLLIQRPGIWAAVMPLRDVADPQRIGAEFAKTAARTGAKVELLDLKTASDRLLNQYRREALLLASLGSLVIAALLLVHFRSLRQTLVVMAPLGVAVVITVALLTVGGHRLSIFNLFGLLLVVAVGSNYCLFFQRGGMAGEEGERTVISLLLANICTVLGFGVLSLSGIPVLYGIGSTVAIGTALSLIAAAILTPGLAVVHAPHDEATVS
jgi:predicted exporter